MELGNVLNEIELKRVLRGLNLMITFDVGGNLDIPHPAMNVRQGVFYNGKHVCSMDRGFIPEFGVYELEKTWDKKSKSIVKRRGRVIRVGWRDTLERIFEKNIPKVTRETVCSLLGVSIKYPSPKTGRPEHHINVDHEHGTVKLV